GEAGVAPTTGRRGPKRDAVAPRGAASPRPPAGRARGGVETSEARSGGSGVGGAEKQAGGEKNTGLQPPPDNSKDRRSGGEAAVHRARASTRGTGDEVAKRDVSLPPPLRGPRRAKLALEVGEGGELRER